MSRCVFRNFKNDYVSGYDYSLVLNSLIELLKIEFNDDEDWIEYFIWELDFGKKYKDGMITNKNNEIIDLSNVENLYKFLNKTNSRV